MRKTPFTENSILCIRPDFMGDVLMTTPAFKALKESFPGTKLTLLSSKSGAAIARFIPEIDEVLTADFPWEKTNEIITSKEILALIQLFKEKKFDRAIIFTAFSQNSLVAALICYLAEIPKRLAYSTQKPYALLTDWVVDKEPREGVKHEVERQLALVERIGAKTSDTHLSLHIPEDAKKTILKILTDHQVSPLRPFIIIHPGARSIKRQYSPSGFAEIAVALHELGYQIIVTGSKDEKELAKLISEYTEHKVISLTGKLSLAEFIALISRSSLLISNNTGPVHIAAAVGTPVVDLYALTNPQHTPWQVPAAVLYFEVAKELRHEVVCDEIPPNAIPLESSNQVVAEALKLLKKREQVAIYNI